MGKLNGMHIAVMIADGVEQAAVFEPVLALRGEGAGVELVGLKAPAVRTWRGGDWGETLPVDRLVRDARAVMYDALYVPSGVLGADSLRGDEAAVDLVLQLVVARKPVAALGHGLWLFADAGVLRGRRLSAGAAIRNDLINAGAQWLDDDVVCDRGLVSARSAHELSAFVPKLVQTLAETQRPAPRLKYDQQNAYDGERWSISANMS